MNVIINKNGEELYASIEGQMDAQTSPHIEEQLIPALEGVKVMTLDLGKLEYISSAGLRVLLIVMQIMEEQGGDLGVKNVRPDIMSILDITGFSGDLKFI